MTDREIAVVTGSLGLVGAAAVRRFSALGLKVLGIDNDSRRTFFGAEASNAAMLPLLEKTCAGYRHLHLDIRDDEAISDVFRSLGAHIAVVVHAAAQPSHDWAATDPVTDFAVNATATLQMLERCRRFAPEALFLFVSTNKVYGDRPNALPLRDLGSRFDLDDRHPFCAFGIDESMEIDHTRHSLFGVSKAAADLMTQEYASRFGMRTIVFRAGCLTGEDHRGVKAHGFLAYLCARVRSGQGYEVIGHRGKQVRDNLHADDLAEAFARCYLENGPAAVYNIGGSRQAACSVNEALAIAGSIVGRIIDHEMTDSPRYGDHVWWISDVRRFQADYPGWTPRFSAAELIERLLAKQASRRCDTHR